MVEDRCLWGGVLDHMDTSLLSWIPILVGASLTIYYFGKEKRASIPIFDMPLEIAIQQRLSVQPSHITYESDADAERLAASDIHKLACNGKIRIGGEAHKGTHPVRIKPRKLKRLTPYDCATLKGPVWILGPKDPEYREFSKEEDDGSYWGLRVGQSRYLQVLAE